MMKTIGIVEVAFRANGRGMSPVAITSTFADYKGGSRGRTGLQLRPQTYPCCSGYGFFARAAFAALDGATDRACA